MNNNLCSLAVLISIFGVTSTHADISLYKRDNTSIDANIAAITGIFYSKKTISLDKNHRVKVGKKDICNTA